MGGVREGVGVACEGVEEGRGGGREGCDDHARHEGHRTVQRSLLRSAKRERDRVVLSLHGVFNIMHSTL